MRGIILSINRKDRRGRTTQRAQRPLIFFALFAKAFAHFAVKISCRHELMHFGLAANLIIDLGVPLFPLGRGDQGESAVVLP